MTDLIRPDEGVRVRGLRRVEFEQMVAQGMFEGEPIELLGGELVWVSPQGSPHGWAITRLTAMLAPLMARGLDVRIQLPLAVDDVSLPEPDVAVTDTTTPMAHPLAAHAAIEVSVTSQRLDLVHKAPRYAAAGIPLYVVLDMARARALVHRDPTPDGYGRVDELGPGDELDVLGAPIDLALLLADRWAADGTRVTD